MQVNFKTHLNLFKGSRNSTIKIKVTPAFKKDLEKTWNFQKYPKTAIFQRVNNKNLIPFRSEREFIEYLYILFKNFGKRQKFIMELFDPNWED